MKCEDLRGDTLAYQNHNSQVSGMQLPTHTTRQSHQSTHPIMLARYPTFWTPNVSQHETRMDRMFHSHLSQGVLAKDKFIHLVSPKLRRLSAIFSAKASWKTPAKTVVREFHNLTISYHILPTSCVGTMRPPTREGADFHAAKRQLGLQIHLLHPILGLGFSRILEAPLFSATARNQLTCFDLKNSVRDGKLQHLIVDDGGLPWVITITRSICRHFLHVLHLCLPLSSSLVSSSWYNINQYCYDLLLLLCTVQYCMVDPHNQRHSGWIVHLHQP